MEYWLYTLLKYNINNLKKKSILNFLLIIILNIKNNFIKKCAVVH